MAFPALKPELEDERLDPSVADEEPEGARAKAAEEELARLRAKLRRQD